MPNLSVVIPVSGKLDMTHTCIDTLLEHNEGQEPIEIIIIDNKSETAFKRDDVIVIRNEENVGFWGALLQGIRQSTANIVLTMHNDVFVYDHTYQERILHAFASDSKLAIAGFFGARGVTSIGARIHPESNMLGRKYGTHGSLHGAYLETSSPSVVFDSYTLIFDKEKLFTIAYEDIPEYHWTDRVITLRLLAAGYHAVTLGIAHDHGGGQTALRTDPEGTTKMERLAESLCTKHNLEKSHESWDNTYYEWGANQFLQEFLAYTKQYHTMWVTDSYVLCTQ